jgi:glycosyltransferase involved in cell wall biosynthesis
MKRIVCFGPGPIFKGGLANYNTSLAKALDQQEGTEVYIVSWTQQYPAIIPRDFLDKKSKTDLLQGTNIKVHYITNYNNPFTWYNTYKLIRTIAPDMVIFQWSIAVQGLPLSYIAGKIKKYTDIEVLFDLHFVKQKEGSVLDNFLTRIGIRHANTYIVHAMKTAHELEELLSQKKFAIVEKGRSEREEQTSVIKLFHPVYNMFSPDPDFDVNALKNKLNLKKHVFLFFGFIRRYKGLHNAIKAFAKLAKERDDVSLLIVGESFWQTLDQKKVSTFIKRIFFSIVKKILLKKQDDERNYRPLRLIKKFGIEDRVTVVNDFVPNEEVHQYFQVSDAILLFYLTATPSGVESIAYNFKLPILATKTGHFPETVQDGYNGYLAEPGNINNMKEAMNKVIEKPIPTEHVVETSKNMSWDRYAKAILGTLS